MMALMLVIAECVGLGLVLAPFAIHRLNIWRWGKNHLEIPVDKVDLPITVLLPVWNEEKVIQLKLNNLAKQEIKTSLLLIDSASTDNTINLANKWLKENPKSFISTEVIILPSRDGKTAAVAKAMDHLSGFEGLIAMTDADAIFDGKALLRARRWFANDTIGAVGATPSRSGNLPGEASHRELYSMTRYGESCYDSTPFLEGSLLVWRSNLVKSTDLNIMSNADDAQIATAVRLAGFRAIQDPELKFTDYMPSTRVGQRRQKVRRAQGLIRHLSRKREKLFDRKMGRFGVILRMQAWMIIISPLLLLMVMVFALLRNFSVLMVGMGQDAELFLHLTALIVEGIFILSWLLMRFEIRVPVLSILGTILVAMEHLNIAMFQALRGNSLHMWAQHEDVRQALAEANE
jgi:cellulose synthase/poly-beta-1,6-N-acetylglucosamine synthase-like glycosyltransferase